MGLLGGMSWESSLGVPPLDNEAVRVAGVHEVIHEEL